MNILKDRYRGGQFISTTTIKSNTQWIKDTRALSYYTNLLAVCRIVLKYDIPWIKYPHQIRNHTTIPSILTLPTYIPP